MKLHEEFKEYTEMWEYLNEWVDKNGNKTQIGKTTSASPAPDPTVNSNNTTNTANKLYIIFNYYKPNNLDDFWMLAATNDRAEAVRELIKWAEDRIERLGQIKNTLVCHLIDPADYDMTANDFIAAAEDKYNGGEDLHYDHAEVVYALSAMTTKTPLYELSMGDVDTEFYSDFLDKNSRAVGITYDDLYDSYFDSRLVSQIFNHKDFQKFMKNKLTNDINKIL